MGCTEGYRGLKIMTHPHGKTGEPVSLGYIAQHREMRGRFLILGGDAHQPAQIQIEGAAICDEGICLIGQNPRFLRFTACIYLHE